MTTDAIEFVKRTVSPMATFTFPFLSSIVGILGADDGEHFGTAFRCVLAGRRVLITAKHVFDQAIAAPLGAGWASERGQPPMPLPKAPSFVDAPTDLAGFVLDQPPDGDGTDWWPEDRIDVNANARAHDYLFLHGFPGTRSRFSFGGLRRKSLPYGVMERDDELPDDVRPHEFAMDYDPNNMLLPSGIGADFVDPSGLSGSPVFRIGAYGEDASKWRPESALLVGVVARWNHDKRVLLATAAAKLLDFARS